LPAHRFLEIRAPIAERPMLPGAHSLQQKLDRKQLIPRPGGIRHPFHKTVSATHKYLLSPIFYLLSSIFYLLTFTFYRSAFYFLKTLTIIAEESTNAGNPTN
jgi:hypothetical protein